jgi:hypothetical protein
MWMKIFFFTVFLLASKCALAGMPGAPSDHDLNCVSTNHKRGVSYQVSVSTQALAPQYSVRGIKVISKILAPGAQPRAENLKQIKQDEKSAVFAGGSPASPVRLELDKKSFTAKIYVAEKLEYSCH